MAASDQLLRDATCAEQIREQQKKKKEKKNQTLAAKNKTKVEEKRIAKLHRSEIRIANTLFGI